MEKAKEYTSEEQQWLTENRLSRFQNRITPSWIRDMGENEIFVFGSNVNGYHGGGAARFAMNNFGAVWGNGEGIPAPTLDFEIGKIGLPHLISEFSLMMELIGCKDEIILHMFQ